MRTLLYTMLIMVMALSPAQGQSRHNAMITALKGKVMVISEKGSARDAHILQKISKGDRIEGKKGSSLTVSFFSDGHTERISGLFNAEVMDNALKSKTSPIDSRATLNIMTAAITPRPVEVERAGIQKIRGPLVATIIKTLSPADDEALLTGTPHFRWYVSPDSKYDARYFVLENLSTGTRHALLNITREQRSLDLPEAIATLEKGNWEWTLQTGPSEGKLASFTFTVVSDEEREEVCAVEKAARKALDDTRKAAQKKAQETRAKGAKFKRDADELLQLSQEDYSACYSLISYYLQHRYYQKAIEEAQSICKKSRNSAAQQVLADIYTTAGLTEQADEILKKIPQSETESRKP